MMMDKWDCEKEMRRVVGGVWRAAKDNQRTETEPTVGPRSTGEQR